MFRNITIVMLLLAATYSGSVAALFGGSLQTPPESVDQSSSRVDTGQEVYVSGVVRYVCGPVAKAVARKSFRVIVWSARDIAWLTENFTKEPVEAVLKDSKSLPVKQITAIVSAGISTDFQCVFVDSGARFYISVVFATGAGGKKPAVEIVVHSASRGYHDVWMNFLNAAMAQKSEHSGSLGVAKGVGILGIAGAMAAFVYTMKQFLSNDGSSQLAKKQPSALSCRLEQFPSRLAPPSRTATYVPPVGLRIFHAPAAAAAAGAPPAVRPVHHHDPNLFARQSRTPHEQTEMREFQFRAALLVRAREQEEQRVARRVLEIKDEIVYAGSCTELMPRGSSRCFAYRITVERMNHSTGDVVLLIGPNEASLTEVAYSIFAGNPADYLRFCFIFPCAYPSQRVHVKYGNRCLAGATRKLVVSREYELSLGDMVEKVVSTSEYNAYAVFPSKKGLSYK